MDETENTSKFHGNFRFIKVLKIQALSKSVFLQGLFSQIQHVNKKNDLREREYSQFGKHRENLRVRRFGRKNN